MYITFNVISVGSLRNQWCMRFEAKNAYTKGLFGKCLGSLPYTIAECHQKLNYMCLQLLSPPSNNSMNFLYRGDEIGTGSECLKAYSTVFM